MAIVGGVSCIQNSLISRNTSGYFVKVTHLSGIEEQMAFVEINRLLLSHTPAETGLSEPHFLTNQIPIAITCRAHAQCGK